MSWSLRMPPESRQGALAGGQRVAGGGLIKAGTADENAQLQADLLVDAEARGLPSHGLLRLPRVIARIANGVCDPAAIGRLTWQGDALALVDGLHRLGAGVGVPAAAEGSARG